MARFARYILAVVFGAGLLLGAGAAAALNMSYGGVVVQNLSSDGFTATNSVLSFDGGTTDELYQMFGYLGNANGVVPVTTASRDFRVTQGITQVAIDTATSVLTLNNRGGNALGLSGGAITVSYQFTLVPNPTPGQRGTFKWDITLTNNTATTQALTFYSYLDLDLGGTASFGDDVATGSLSQIVVSDGANPTAQPYVWYASSGGATHYAIGAYPSVANLLNGMGSAQNLSDPTGTFGPGDFTGAFQYDFVLAPGASVVLANPVPEPGLAALLLLAASALVGARRRS
jgi:hypothetical protein